MICVFLVFSAFETSTAMAEGIPHKSNRIATEVSRPTHAGGWWEDIREIHGVRAGVH